jgi:hypothetical protein
VIEGKRKKKKMDMKAARRNKRLLREYVSGSPRSWEIRAQFRARCCPPVNVIFFYKREYCELSGMDLIIEETPGLFGKKFTMLISPSGRGFRPQMPKNDEKKKNSS